MVASPIKICNIFGYFLVQHHNTFHTFHSIFQSFPTPFPRSQIPTYCSTTHSSILCQSPAFFLAWLILRNVYTWFILLRFGLNPARPLLIVLPFFNIALLLSFKTLQNAYYIIPTYCSTTHFSILCQSPAFFLAWLILRNAYTWFILLRFGLDPAHPLLIVLPFFNIVPLLSFKILQNVWHTLLYSVFSR